MMSQTPKQQADLIERLEALHLIVLEIDAYHGAFEDLFHRLPWKHGANLTRRRNANRLDCFVSLTSVTITRLVDYSRATIRVAIAQRRSWMRRR
jgi:hypothetical protein